MYPNFDDHLNRIEVPVTLGLDSWAWVLTMLPETDLVTESLRRQIGRSPQVASSRVLMELLKLK